MKARQNHRLYVEVLRRMTPEQRLRKAFELHEFAKELFRHGLRRRHPDLTVEEFEALERKLEDRWHNRTY